MGEENRASRYDGGWTNGRTNTSVSMLELCTAKNTSNSQAEGGTDGSRFTMLSSMAGLKDGQLNSRHSKILSKVSPNPASRVKRKLETKSHGIVIGSKVKSWTKAKVVAHGKGKAAQPTRIPLKEIQRSQISMGPVKTSLGPSKSLSIVHDPMEVVNTP